MSLMQCMSFAASTARDRNIHSVLIRRVRDRSKRIADRKEGFYRYRNVVGSVVVAYRDANHVVEEEGIPDMVVSENELSLATPAINGTDTECLHPGDYHNRHMRADILYSAQEREVVG
jgi:hypothetical protein